MEQQNAGALDAKPTAFKKVARRAVRVSGEELVTTGFLEQTGERLLLVEPRLGAGDLIAWAGEHRGMLDQWLATYGAVLFRGFSLEGPEDFEQFVTVSCGGSLEYTEKSSPRSRVSGKIYTSTDYPPEMPIFLHNEQSYNSVFPLRILFFCLLAAERGGATPLADVRRVYGRIDPGVRRRFVREGYLYVRNFGDGCGLTWQEAFGTEDPAEVEKYCRQSAIDYNWKYGGRLRTCQHRRAAGLHPRTGEPVWFNHLTFFHVSSLEPAVREAMLREFAPEDLPNNTYYADGTAIEPDVLDHLRAVYQEETVSFPWRNGDLLMLDNMLTAHARESFSGPRKIVASMAEPLSWEAVADPSDV